MDLPDRLKPTGDEEREQDVLHPSTGAATNPFMNMNQSIFGLIAAAGSNVDFHDRFEGQSSDEDEAHTADGEAHRKGKSKDTTQSTVLPKPSSKDNKGHRRKFSDSKLIRSVPMLSRLSSSKSRSKKDERKPAPQIQEESEPEEPEADADNRLLPVMSRMLEARAEVAARPSFDVDRRTSDKGRSPPELTDVEPTELAKRLQKIFDFDEPEELISGWHYCSGHHTQQMLTSKQNILAGSCRVCFSKATSTLPRSTSVSTHTFRKRRLVSSNPTPKISRSQSTSTKSPSLATS